ncbi:hypothetical protein BCV72DRAFT_69106 [Rhizopus microsporus var. microsporus]|uniref:Uncharacterized protein n=1 Tax=Rhizopus microsporus var. microsporus TaxID=86635 RepID=A0A1X0RB28_RHIZD|nr:hypothetical protein BCV72DRAFT_69106 [Rhizopus microsporus var. microsporus]
MRKPNLFTLTSQICNKCKMNSFSVSGSKRRVHAVNFVVWNRDVNSALNIYNIFVYKSKHDNESLSPSEDFHKTNSASWIKCAAYNGSAFLNASISIK